MLYNEFLNEIAMIPNYREEQETTGLHNLVQINKYTKKPYSIYLDNRLLSDYYIKPNYKKNNNIFYTLNTFNKMERNSNNIDKVKGLWVDIDSDKYGYTNNQGGLILQISDIMLEKGIPPANYLIETGHGIHLIWLFTECVGYATDNIRYSYQHLLKQLSIDFSQVGGDASAVDPGRLLRLPGSYNLKNNEFKEVKIYSPKDYHIIYSFFPDVLNNERYPFDYWLDNYRNYKIKNNSKNKSFIPKVVKSRGNLITLYISRLNDLEEIVKLRSYEMDGYRHSFLYLYLGTLKNMDYSKAEIEFKFKEMNQLFTHPINNKDVKTMLKQDIRGNFKNETIIRKLNLTDIEMMNLKTIISKTEKNRRHNLARRKKYKPIKNKNRIKKIIQILTVYEYKNFIDYYGQRYTDKEVAEKMNISIRTVQRHKRKYEKMLLTNKREFYQFKKLYNKLLSDRLDRHEYYKKMNNKMITVENLDGVKEIQNKIYIVENSIKEEVLFDIISSNYNKFQLIQSIAS